MLFKVKWRYGNRIEKVYAVRDVDGIIQFLLCEHDMHWIWRDASDYLPYTPK